MARWKYIRGFDNYKVSDEGEVRNAKFDKPAKMSAAAKYSGRSERLRVNIYDNTARLRGLYVDETVLITFGFPKPTKRSIVIHKNGDQTDNRLENLEWQQGESDEEKAFRKKFRRNLKG